MSDEPRDPTPEEEAEISRLLAEAGGPVAMPDDVVARLEATLAALVRDEQPAEPAAAPVVPLASRRRWPRMVLAAAAVVVAGYAVGTVVTDTSSGDAESATAGEAAGGSGQEDAGGPEESAGGGSADEAPGEQSAPSATAQRGTDALLLDGRVARLRSDRLEADVSEVLTSRTLLRDSLASKSYRENRELSASKPLQCDPPALGRGQRWLPARYDGDRAVLVTGPRADGSVPAEVYGCDGELLASVVVGGP